MLLFLDNAKYTIWLSLRHAWYFVLFSPTGTFELMEEKGSGKQGGGGQELCIYTEQEGLLIFGFPKHLGTHREA